MVEGFSKIRCTSLAGPPIIRIIVFLHRNRIPSINGNYHIGALHALPKFSWRLVSTHKRV